METNLARRVPWFKFIHSYFPSEDLADVQLGGIFGHANGKRFMLIARDPWKATVIRYTFLDEFLSRLGMWLGKVRRNLEI